MSSVVTPQELRRLAEEKEAEKAREAIQQLNKESEGESQLQAAFLEQELRPDVGERVSAAVKRAAEQGQHEVMAITFPSAWTNDRGRRINNGEPDWPASLTGFAKRA